MRVKAGFMLLLKIVLQYVSHFDIILWKSANKIDFFVVLLKGGLMPDDFCTCVNTLFLFPAFTLDLRNRNTQHSV